MASRQHDFLPLDTHSIVSSYIGHPMPSVSVSLKLSSTMLEQSARRDANMLKEGLESYVQRYGIFMIPVIEDFLRSVENRFADRQDWLLHSRCFQVLEKFSKGSHAATAALARLTMSKPSLLPCACYSEDDRWGRSFWEMNLQFPKPSLRLARWSLACHSERFVESSLRAGLVLTRFGCVSSDRCHSMRVLSWSATASHSVDSLVNLAETICASTTLSIRLDECDPEDGEEFEAVMSIANRRASSKVDEVLTAWRCLPDDQKLDQSANIEARVRPWSVNFLIHVISSVGVKGELYAKLWFA